MNGQQINPDSPFADTLRGVFRELARSQRDWQDRIGFGVEGHSLRAELEIAQQRTEAESWGRRTGAEETNLRNYYVTKLALITTEVAEAIEEIRNNHAIDERYYSYPPVPPSLAVEFASGGDAIEYWQTTQPGKPEGVLSELADIIIRVFSLAGEADLDIADAVIEKLNYNATRAQKHGGKAV